MQGDSQLSQEQSGCGVSLRDTSTLQGIELATFRLPANQLYLLSHMPPDLSST